MQLLDLGQVAILLRHVMLDPLLHLLNLLVGFLDLVFLYTCYFEVLDSGHVLLLSLQCWYLLFQLFALFLKLDYL